jgi:hypothetical protein
MARILYRHAAAPTTENAQAKKTAASLARLAREARGGVEADGSSGSG